MGSCRIAAISNSGLGAPFTLKTETGKGWKKTRIKPDYFKKPKEVKKRVRKFIEEANKLALVTKKGEIKAIGEQFEALFKACKACHKKFREK